MRTREAITVPYLFLIARKGRRRPKRVAASLGERASPSLLASASRARVAVSERASRLLPASVPCGLLRPRARGSSARVTVKGCGLHGTVKGCGRCEGLREGLRAREAKAAQEPDRVEGARPLSARPARRRGACDPTKGRPRVMKDAELEKLQNCLQTLVRKVAHA